MFRYLASIYRFIHASYTFKLLLFKLKFRYNKIISHTVPSISDEDTKSYVLHDKAYYSILFLVSFSTVTVVHIEPLSLLNGFSRIVALILFQLSFHFLASQFLFVVVLILFLLIHFSLILVLCVLFPIYLTKILVFSILLLDLEFSLLLYKF